MRTDVIVVGGGLAGSIAAAMLGRAGYTVLAVDPHETYPSEFRCEKLEQDHIRVLTRTGLAAGVTRAGTNIDCLWIARHGRLVDKMPLMQYAMPYETMVNAVRSQIPPQVDIRRCWVTSIWPGPDFQRVIMSDGTTAEGRLVILASGLHWSVREMLGIGRDLVSPCHSVTLGFDIEPANAAQFAFPALQYHPEKIGTGVAYLTLFRMGDRMRGNLFLYLPLKSPSVSAFRSDPTSALHALLPGLSKLIGSYRVRDPVKVRPTDLYTFNNLEQTGVVMVGDAFGGACPATGTGTIKVFNDVERLCNHHIPIWLATQGMSAEKLSSFYRDAMKIAADKQSFERAYTLRALCTERGLRWRILRTMRFWFRLAAWTVRSISRSVPQREISESGLQTL